MMRDLIELFGSMKLKRIGERCKFTKAYIYQKIAMQNDYTRENEEKRKNKIEEIK